MPIDPPAKMTDPFLETNTDATTHVHISDVECRGETIYFAVVDRFHSGKKDSLGKDTNLEDVTHQDWHKYWGGDLQGIVDKIDYLHDLGVTALWLTPLFEQVEGSAGGSAPIHGYWTQDFKRINARWVNNPEEVRLFSQNTVLDTLIDELHKRRMKFILDIVCNHSSPVTTQGKGKIYDDGKLIADFDNDKNHWYHHYGDVKDWNNEWQIKNCELCGLATFNENNTDFRRYIIGSIKMWLDKGVDALRIDTVKHMPNWFWQEFTCEMHTHKPNVFIFGEWIHNHPGNPVSVDFANHSGMTVFDFGLCQAIRECIAGNAEAGFQLVQEILDQDGNYRNASELITMYENHDMPRLQSLGASDQMLELATCLIMTMRGIPCLYYGYEQYLHNDTDGGGDPYNRPMMEKWNNDSYAFHLTRRLSDERGKNPAIQWGRPLAENRRKGPLRFPPQVPGLALPRHPQQGHRAHHRQDRHRAPQRLPPVHPHRRENRNQGWPAQRLQDRRRPVPRLQLRRPHRHRKIDRAGPAQRHPHPTRRLRHRHWRLPRTRLVGHRQRRSARVHQPQHLVHRTRLQRKRRPIHRLQIRRHPPRPRRRPRPRKPSSQSPRHPHRRRRQMA